MKKITLTKTHNNFIKFFCLSLLITFNVSAQKNKNELNEVSSISVTNHEVKNLTRIAVTSAISNNGNNTFTIKGKIPESYNYVALKVDGVWQDQSALKTFSMTTKTISIGNHTVWVYAKTDKGEWDHGVAYQVNVHKEDEDDFDFDDEDFFFNDDDFDFEDDDFDFDFEDDDFDFDFEDEDFDFEDDFEDDDFDFEDDNITNEDSSEEDTNDEDFDFDDEDFDFDFGDDDFDFEDEIETNEESSEEDTNDEDFDFDFGDEDFDFDDESTDDDTSEQDNEDFGDDDFEFDFEDESSDNDDFEEDIEIEAPSVSGEQRFAPDIHSDSFSSSNWQSGYKVGNQDNTKFVNNGGYQGSGGLRVQVSTGEHYGAHIKKSLSNKKEVYAQYKVYYEDSFSEYVGKSPGWDGARGRGGFGGVPATGNNGWSARGSIDNISGNTVRNKYYVYHVDQQQSWGDSNYWTSSQTNTQGESSGDIQPGRWYTIDMYIKVNSPGQKNGVLKAWIDGKKVFERTNYKFTNTSSNNYDKVDNFWINYYHGGSETSPKNAFVKIDDFRLGTRLITLGAAKDFKTEESFVKIYPNPANDILNLDFNKNHKVNEIQLIDLTGRMVANKSINKDDKSTRLNLNDHGVSKGIYILKIVNEDSFEVIKVVKN